MFCANVPAFICANTFAGAVLLWLLFCGGWGLNGVVDPTTPGKPVGSIIAGRNPSHHKG